MKLRGYAMAPKIMVEEKKPILYMYREEPDNAYDSGWRFFSGEESDEYVNNPENIGIYDIVTIANLYPDVRPFLTFPAGSTMERNNSNSQFRII